MNTSLDRKENLISIPRQAFIFGSLCFLFGDVIGALHEYGALLVGVFLWAVYSIYTLWGQKKLQTIIFIGGIFFVFGYGLGSLKDSQHQSSYHLIQHITNNFFLKGEISVTLHKKAYQTDRSMVYIGYIDKFAKLDKGSSNTLWEKETNVDLWKEFHSFFNPSYGSPSILIEIPSNIGTRVGDQIQFEGRIQENLDFPLEGYDRYAYFRGGYGKIFVPSYRSLSRKSPSYMDRAREGWEKIFITTFPRDVASILLGMTIGSTRYLTADLKNAFIASGTAHILVVSGSNIAFLILFLSFFLKYISFSRILLSTIITLCIIGYITIVGTDVSVIRASIMGILSYLAIIGGMRASSRALLSLSAIILTIIEPLSPLYDAGFGLSFGATAGILIFQPLLSSFFQKYKIPLIISATLSLTIGASLGSLPILIFHFHTLPIAQILVNVCIAGLLGWILLSSILFLLLIGFSISLGYYFGFLVYIPTKIIILISQFFENGIILSIPETMSLYISIFLLGFYATFFYFGTN